MRAPRRRATFSSMQPSASAPTNAAPERDSLSEAAGCEICNLPKEAPEVTLHRNA